MVCMIFKFQGWCGVPWSLFSFSVFGNLLPIGFIALKRFLKFNFICDFWKFTSHRKSSPLKDFQKTILSATYLKNQWIKSAENFSNERRNGFLVHLRHTLLPVVTGRRPKMMFFSNIFLLCLWFFLNAHYVICFKID